MLNGTQTGRDVLYDRSVVLFYYLWLKAGGCFSLDDFNILCLWQNGYCANKWHFFHTLSKQMHELNKVFMSTSSTTIVNMRHYNQNKTKVLWRSFNSKPKRSKRLSAWQPSRFGTFVSKLTETQQSETLNLQWLWTRTFSLKIVPETELNMKNEQAISFLQAGLWDSLLHLK